MAPPFVVWVILGVFVALAVAIYFIARPTLRRRSFHRRFKRAERNGSIAVWIPTRPIEAPSQDIPLIVPSEDAIDGMELTNRTRAVRTAATQTFFGWETILDDLEELRGANPAVSFLPSNLPRPEYSETYVGGEKQLRASGLPPIQECKPIAASIKPGKPSKNKSITYTIQAPKKSHFLVSTTESQNLPESASAPKMPQTRTVPIGMSPDMVSTWVPIIMPHRAAPGSNRVALEIHLGGLVVPRERRSMFGSRK